ncbi:LuxR C-terminal-related transcriptional regulator [Streptomyces sp. MMG1121]|uniref:LuxR C-terminal-related transcriptional regulator n=1 Tax=Streptomyces sp. MMG1121 TaxID=1415544 RepID=UPI0006AF8FBD|nr:LuxR family transcriptional regulator [Streptomyces sp. MMG1121]KOV67540.1 LuxR family transcriptional regulator [Streptomyces sp. MMG1121]
MGPTARPLPQVRGREQQLAQISANLHTVTSTRRSKVLLVEAAAGAGKTRLLVEAVNLAGANGFSVVNGVPAGCDALPRAAPAPSDAQPPAPRTAEDGFHTPRASFAIEAARALLRNRAEQVRTVVTLDDLHLANLSDLAVLCDLVVGLGARPILWLLAFTPDSAATPYESVAACLGKLRGRLPVEHLRELEPLSGEELGRLVADCAGAAPEPSLLALVESVNDTPRAVIELVRGLVEDGDLCVVDGTSRLQPGSAGSAPGGAVVCLPAPVPKRFSALVQRDLRSLSEFTIKALRLAAVLGSPFAPEDLSAMLGEAPVGLLAAVDEAVDRGLLVCGERDLAFRSEPVWRVLLDSVPAPVCALLRRQAAEMLLSRPDGIERAALQLMHVARPGNAEALRVIAEGSQRLLATDPSTAAALATRAMEMLSPGQAERVRLAKTGVDAFTRAGHLDRAIALAKDTIDEAARLAVPVPPELAADIASLRTSMSAALLLLGNAPMAYQAARDALAAQEGASQHREVVLTHLAASYLNGDDTAVQRARKILSAPDRHGRGVQVGAMTFHAFSQWRDGHVADAVGILRQAVTLDRGDEDVPFLDPRWFLAFTLTRTDEYEEAAAVVHSFARTIVPGARTLAAAVPAVLRAPLHLAQGRLDEAEEAARAGVGADGPSVPMLAPQAWLVLALAALRRGELSQAQGYVTTLEKDFPQHPHSPWWAARLLLNAQLAEARADARVATDVLAETGMHAGALRELVLEDSAAAAWCVRCALAADMPDLAGTVVETTEYLRTHNPRVASVVAAATHARALAERDADALARAVRLHRNPWAQAAAAEDHAGVLLDRGDHESAIGELNRSMSVYGGLGGERDAARVRARLRRLGVRRRHWTQAKRPVSGWESLTKTERKVAELVADGLTNRQAARHLFISSHTVGFHLRQIYRKLGIRSRTALVQFKA